MTGPTSHEYSDTRSCSMVCVECGHSVDFIYRDFGGGNIRLKQCRSCGNFADKYVEYERVLLLIDFILHRPQVYRHFLYNRYHASRRCCSTRQIPAQSPRYSDRNRHDPGAVSRQGKMLNYVLMQLFVACVLAAVYFEWSQRSDTVADSQFLRFSFSAFQGVRLHAFARRATVNLCTNIYTGRSEDSQCSPALASAFQIGTLIAMRVFLWTAYIGGVAIAVLVANCCINTDSASKTKRHARIKSHRIKNRCDACYGGISRLSHLVRALVLANFGHLVFVLPMLVWEYDEVMLEGVLLLILTSNVVALHVVLKTSAAASLALVICGLCAQAALLLLLHFCI